MTKGLKNACKKKNMLYKEYIIGKTQEAEIKYKRYKNKLTNILRVCKKEYYNKQIENNKGNSKGLWRVLNKIIRKGSSKPKYPDHFINGSKCLNKMDEIANGFNNFFVNIGPNLAKTIPQPSNMGLGDFIESNPNSMFLSPVREDEVNEIIKNSKSKSSCDAFDIDMSLLKKVKLGIIKPLTFICNLSFTTGVFPCRMKIARVIPLFKTGVRHLFTNYRPVSLLPQFSKILEKLFITRLNTFIERNNLLSDSQYGFRSGRSTALALIELTEEIAKAIDGKKFAIGVYLDIKKAYDTLNHSALIYKLDKYGMRGLVSNWLESYLANRQQFVSMENQKSKCSNITCGLPQGSVLAPLLFILFINDICKVSTMFKFIIFADDTSIVCSGKDLQKLLQDTTRELGKVAEWFNVNKLSLNVDKTKFMVFANRYISGRIQLSIGKANVERVYEIKFLGTMIDCKLKWKSHITHVRNKVSRSVAVLYRARPVLEQTMLRLLYCSLVLPYLSYCTEVWGIAHQNHLEPLIRLQKKAIRLVHKVGYLDHTNPLFLESKSLKLTDICKFKVGIIMYKANNHMLPGNIQSLFVERDRHYHLRGNHTFTKSYARTVMKERCMIHHGVKVWYELPSTLRGCSTVMKFKKLFKSIIMEEYGKMEANE